MSKVSNNFSLKRKGISLPVEMIVIVAIAVLVMVSIAAFFIFKFGESGNTIATDADFGEMCARIGTQFSCNPELLTDLSAEKASSGSTYHEICAQKSPSCNDKSDDDFRKCCFALCLCSVN